LAARSTQILNQEPCQKAMRSEGTGATCSADTWGIAPWPSLVLSTPGYSAAPSQLTRRERGLEGANHVKIMPALPRHCKVWSVSQCQNASPACTLEGRQALTQGAIIARVFACWTCAVEVHLADTADVVFGDIPSPGRDGVPLFDPDLHLGGCEDRRRNEAV
jgi:hypothetical protein